MWMFRFTDVFVIIFYIPLCVPTRGWEALHYGLLLWLSPTNQATAEAEVSSLAKINIGDKDKLNEVCSSFYPENTNVVVIFEFRKKKKSHCYFATENTVQKSWPTPNFIILYFQAAKHSCNL